MSHEDLPLAPPTGEAIGDPSLAPHSVGIGGLLDPQDGGFAYRRISVIGGESCGTRLMSHLLSRANCEVLHRSFPYEGSHLRHWPVEPCRDYEPDAYVVMTRDWWAAAQSQVREGHVPTEEVAFANLQEAWCLMSELVRGQQWRAIGYESLVQRPQIVFDNVCAWLEIPTVDVGEIFDANERYFGERILKFPSMPTV